MSLKTTRKMPGWEGVAAGQTATLRLPIGLSFHQIFTDYSGVTLAQIEEMRLVANGEVLQRFSAVELDSMNQYEGRAAAAGTLVIDLDRYNMRTREAEEFTKIGTGLPFANFLPDGSVAPGTDPLKITTFALEADIDAAAAAPAFTTRAMQSNPAPSGIMKKIRKFSYSAPAVGDFEIANLPRQDAINKIYFRSANCTRLQLQRDNFTVFDRTRALNELIQNDGVRVTQAGMIVYDPTEAGNGAERLDTFGVNDLRFILTMSAPEDFEVIVEYLATLKV